MLRSNDETADIGHWEKVAQHLPEEIVADRFLTKEECEAAVFQSIWELGYKCPRCEFEGKSWVLKSRGIFQCPCPDCRFQYSARSQTPLRRKSVPFLDCFKGAEWIIATMAANRRNILTINSFAVIVNLKNYRTVRALRLEMFKELQKPLGGFWGRLICVDAVQESIDSQDRLEALMDYYDFGSLKAPFTKLKK